MRAQQKISTTSGGFGNPLLLVGDRFGSGVVSLGDLDGDGVEDLGVGADGSFGDDRGAAWTVLLSATVRLDFETEDDLVTPLGNGQHLDTEFGRLVTLSSAGPNAGLGSFDSSPGGPNDPSQDLDLLVGTGNLLILQTENLPPDANDFFPRPNDDEDGGTLSFSFPMQVELASVRCIDLDASDGTSLLVLTDTAARERLYTVPSDWTGDRLVSGPRAGVLDLTTLVPQQGFGSIATATQDAGFDSGTVIRLEVHLAGSGALDDLTLSPSGVPQASSSTRNGSGTNTALLTGTSLPTLGRTWSATLDCTGPAAARASLFIRSRAASGTLTPFGEVLVGGALLHQESWPLHTAIVPFAWDIPFDLSLCGLEVHVQGLCGAPPGPFLPRCHVARARLSNALDLCFGL